MALIFQVSSGLDSLIQWLASKIAFSSLIAASVYFVVEITATLNVAGLPLSETKMTEIPRQLDSLLYGESVCEKEEALNNI